MFKRSLFVLCLAVLVIVNSVEYKTVETGSGPIRGLLQKTLWYKKPFFAFRGIPYAAPPIGKLRFKAPEPAKPWKKTLDASKYGKKCAQKKLINSTEASEDCLFLNIFVPVVKNAGNLPVLFWFHGGYFHTGNGEDASFGADYFMEHEAILVTINYRLGILGFMSLGTPEYSGNMGLKDQQLALKWIHDNVEHFGGDKKKITIGGSSTGGQSAALHLINKVSSKYFNQVLCISGTPNSIYIHQTWDQRCLLEILHAKHVSKGKASSSPSDRELIGFLKKLDVDTILEFTEETVHDPYTPWSAITEKQNAIHPFLLEDPMTKLRNTKINKTTLYTITEYEQLLFTIDQNYSSSTVMNKYLEEFKVKFPMYGYYGSNLFETRSYLDKVLNKIKEFYFKNANTHDDRVRQRVVLESDTSYAYFIEKWIEQQVSVSEKKTFYQRFSAKTKLWVYDVFAGTGHGAEGKYIFRRCFYDDVYEQIFRDKDTDRESGIAFKMMMTMQTLFSNFVKYGKPVHNRRPSHNGKSISSFPPVRRLSKMDQLEFVDVRNEGLFPGKAPNANRTLFWERINKKVERLVEKGKDTPKLTVIQQQCIDMKAGRSGKESTAS